MFPELSEFFGGKTAHHNRYVYDMLKAFPSPEKLAHAHLTKLTNILITSSRGKIGRKEAIALKELASKSIGQTSAVLEFELLQTIDLIDYFTTLRATADKEVERIMKEIDPPLYKHTWHWI